MALPTMAILDHPRLVTVLTLWGAALAGFSVLALSSVDIARISMFAGLGALGGLAKLVYAAIAAQVGATAAFVGAKLGLWLLGRMRHPARSGSAKSRRKPAPALTSDAVRPINPALDLGSDSLDAPFESLPPSFRDDEIEPDDASDDIWPALADRAVEQPVDEAEDVFELVAADSFDDETASEQEPDEDAIEASGGVDHPGLDLAAFAAIMDEETRDFEARRAQAQRDRVNRAKAGHPAGGGRFFAARAMAPNGLAKLRETPPENLSLVELVERFAAALHDTQDKPVRAIAAGNAGREKALAEALKALETLTRGHPGGTASGAAPSAPALTETERDLREALTRLQRVRGAA